MVVWWDGPIGAIIFHTSYSDHEPHARLVHHSCNHRAKESAGAACVPPKHKRALRRFEQAAALGHVEAMVSELGCCC